MDTLQDNHHELIAMEQKQKTHLNCICIEEEFLHLERLVSIDEGGVERALEYSITSNENGFVYYGVQLENIEDNSSFLAINKDGSKLEIWQPNVNFKSSLCDGFYFNKESSTLEFSLSAPSFPHSVPWYFNDDITRPGDLRFNHEICEVRQEENSCRFYCVSKLSSYQENTKLLAAIKDSKNIVLRADHPFIKDGLVYYSVLAPLIANKTYFIMIRSDKIQTRVWKPNVNCPAFKINGLYFSVFDHNIIMRDAPERAANTTQSFVTEMHVSENTLHLNIVTFFKKNKQIDVHSVSVSRFRNEELSESFNIKKAAEQKWQKLDNSDLIKHTGQKFVCYEVAIKLGKFLHQSGFYNLMVHTNKGDSVLRSTVKSYEKNDHIFNLDLSEHECAYIVPYVQYDLRFRFEIYTLTKLEAKKVEQLQRNPSDKICLMIGEYSNSARDNGMHLYNYIKKNRPDIEAYYVIDSDSSEIGNLEPSDVVLYGSYKHFEVSSRSNCIVFSHFSEYLYPKIDRISGYKNIRKEFCEIFLQHGVIALKPFSRHMATKYNRYDKFCVSSQREKEIVVNKMKIKEKLVEVTGLSRWDNLRMDNITKREIVLMPTWRDNLDTVNEEAFVRSNFYKHWNAILLDTSLATALDENDIQMNIYVHNILGRFAHLFHSSEHIKILNGTDMQEVFQDHKLLITDYSSVCWDFMYLGKPVIYYPFDYDHLLKLRKGEAYIDYEEELPGPVLKDHDALVSSIIDSINNEFVFSEEYTAKLDKFLPHRDQSNSVRVVEMVERAYKEKFPS